MGKTARIVIFEIAMLLGCFAAALTVSRSTPLRTFLIICAGMLIFGNILLFRALDKAIDPTRKVDNRKLSIAAVIGLLALILQFVWK